MSPTDQHRPPGEAWREIQTHPDRLAIRMLVESGFVSEDIANQALLIAHGFEPGPMPVAEEKSATVMGGAAQSALQKALQSAYDHGVAKAPFPMNDCIQKTLAAMSTSQARPGYACSVCGLGQYETPSGVTCPNGHGGALPAEEVVDGHA